MMSPQRNEAGRTPQWQFKHVPVGVAQQWPSGARPSQLKAKPPRAKMKQGIGAISHVIWEKGTCRSIFEPQ